MIVTGAFIGPVEGESPIGTEKRFSSAKADAEMSVTSMMKISFLMECSPLAWPPRLAIQRQRLFVQKDKKLFAVSQLHLQLCEFNKTKQLSNIVCNLHMNARVRRASLARRPRPAR